MKMKIFTIAAMTLVTLVSCSKNKDMEEETLVSAQGNAEAVTAWETGYSWQREDSADYIVFRAEKSLPALNREILEKGAVVVALKNVPYKPDSLLTEPRIVPFSVIPYYGHDAGRPIYDQHWYIIPRVGGLSLKYRSNRHQFTDEPVIAPDSRVAARYFLLTEADLNRIGKTRENIYGVRYADLVRLLGTSE